MASLLFIPLNNTSEFSIRESHHSQTILTLVNQVDTFNHIRESHHSQTGMTDVKHRDTFNHIRESHHSQTTIINYLPFQ